MLGSPKFLQKPTILLHPPIHTQQLTTSQAFPPTQQCFSRRSTSLFLLLFGFHSLRPSTAKPQEAIQQTPCANNDDKRVTNRAFLDISIDGKPIGKVVIGLFGDQAPLGASRFGSLVSGRAGISYRRKEFVKVMPNYIRHSGIRSGSELGSEKLVEELERAGEKCKGVKNLAGTVSLVVRDPSRPPPKLKLVAKDGKLKVDEEEVGAAPNGTEFVISTKDSPELDDSAVVVGRVLEGMEVLETIGQVKTVQENTTSPYFRVAKLIGDKRAIVAERGFNRPYSKILITNCGLIEE